MYRDGGVEPPRVGVALSGGGNRAAAFSIGVLAGLHGQRRLGDVDVISAVSGGSYALSWFLLQTFYAGRLAESGSKVRRLDGELFDATGRFQRYLEATPTVEGKLDTGFFGLMSVAFDAVMFNVLRLPTMLLGSAAANLLNETSLRSEYREGIQRSYQLLPGDKGSAPTTLSFRDGAVAATQHLDLSVARPPVTYPSMVTFAQSVALPAFVFNMTVRPPRPIASSKIGDRLFEFGAGGFGADSCGYLTWEQTEGHGWEPGVDGDDEEGFAVLFLSLTGEFAVRHMSQPEHRPGHLGGGDQWHELAAEVGAPHPGRVQPRVGVRRAEPAVIAPADTPE